jgi:DNA-binding CsgD family transcriptional regulator
MHRLNMRIVRNGNGLRALSPRELEAVALASDGMSNEGIAIRMGVTLNTVRLKLAIAAAKLQLATGHQGCTRAQLGRWYGENYPRPKNGSGNGDKESA